MLLKRSSPLDGVPTGPGPAGGTVAICSAVTGCYGRKTAASTRTRFPTAVGAAYHVSAVVAAAAVRGHADESHAVACSAAAPLAADNRWRARSCSRGAV